MEILEDAVTVQEDEQGNIVVLRPDGKYLLVNQDEKIHHANDVEKWYSIVPAQHTPTHISFFFVVIGGMIP